MQTAHPPSRKAVIAGWTLSGLLIAFLVFDVTLKFIDPPIVAETMQQLGYPVHLTRTLALLTLLCTILYAIPRTAILGAILLTAYLGGAISTHLRVGSPLFSHLLFGVYLGLFAWGGLYLRDERLRALLPVRRA